MSVSIAKAQQAIQGEMDYNEQTRWRQIGVITVAQALLGDSAKDHASVLALADGIGVLHYLEDGSVAYEWRFRTDGTEDDAPVIQQYSCAGVDHFSHVAQLTLAQGTQVATVGKFVDTITPANEAWFDDSLNVQPSSPSNNIARYGLNAYGNDQFLFIASTLVVTNIYIDARRLS